MVATQVTPLAWTAALVADFQPSVDANPWGFGTAPEVLHGSFAYEFVHAGQRALIAVRPVQRQHGTRLDLLAIVSTGDRLHADALDGALVGLGRAFGASNLAMSTLRPHVAKVCRRMGWGETGILMLKHLDPLQ